MGGMAAWKRGRGGRNGELSLLLSLEEKREKRRLKKELKLAFQDQNYMNAKHEASDNGGIKVGVSVKKIY